MWLKTGIKLLVLWFCLFGLTKGSCLSYGHSCWGAHGKRSSPQTKKIEDDWNVVKIIPDNNDSFKSEISAQLLSDNSPPIPFDNSKVIDNAIMYATNSDESQNNISHRKLPKRRYAFSKYDRQIDTSSPEESESDNTNFVRGDDIKIRNYRLLKILKKDFLA